MRQQGPKEEKFALDEDGNPMVSVSFIQFTVVWSYLNLLPLLPVLLGSFRETYIRSDTNRWQLSIVCILLRSLGEEIYRQTKEVQKMKSINEFLSKESSSSSRLLFMIRL